MQHKFNWEKGLFSESYKIFTSDIQVGSLTNKSFSQITHGDLNGEKYTFKTSGFFKQQTQIIDNYENKIIGEITYSNWMSKATININGKKFDLKYENILNTKWSISSLDGIQIKFNSSTLTGQIYSDTDNALLILAGLFISNYYLQITFAVILIVFISTLIH